MQTKKKIRPYKPTEPTRRRYKYMHHITHEIKLSAMCDGDDYSIYNKSRKKSVEAYFFRSWRLILLIPLPSISFHSIT